MFGALFDAGNCTVASAASGTALTAARPANTANGDYLVAFAYSQTTTAGGFAATPAGWVNTGPSTNREAGTFFKKITDVTAEPTSYTWTARTSARWALAIFRVTGADLATFLDAAGTGAAVTSDTVTLTGISTDRPGCGVLAFAYGNASSGALSDITLPAGFTNGAQVKTPNTTNTSTIAVAYKILAAAGTTGDQVFGTSPAMTTTGGWLIAVRAVPAPTLVDAWLDDAPCYCAQRGGMLDWPEATGFAYDNATAWNPALAIDVPVWPTSDGVWVCCHDQSTLAVFGVDHDIPTTPWATLQSLTTIDGGHPITRLVDVLNAHASGTRVLFIDNKGQLSNTTLLDLLDTYGGNNRFVAKGFITSTIWADAATARGYATWGYGFSADIATNFPAKQARWSLLGLDINASAGDWTSVLGYGKPVLAHFVATAGQAATALARGAAGLMVTGVQEVVPRVRPNRLTATGSVTATTAVTGDVKPLYASA